MPTQLIPVPQTTATPQPCSVPARRIANVSLSTIVLVDQPRAPTASWKSSHLRRQVEPGDQQLAEVGHGPVVGRHFGGVRRAVEQLCEHVQRALEPEIVR